MPFSHASWHLAFAIGVSFPRTVDPDAIAQPSRRETDGVTPALTRGKGIGLLSQPSRFLVSRD
jgi:hypothetical protein